MDIKRAIIKHVSDPLLLWKWGDYAVFRHARELEASQFLSTEELQTLQFHRLQRLLEHAYRRCPFYREQFQTLGLSPEDIRSIADLRLLPVLEKQDIQERFEMMVAEGWPRDDLILDHTGGSTGHLSPSIRTVSAGAGGRRPPGGTTPGRAGRSETVSHTFGAHHATCPRTRGGPGWSAR